MKRYLLKRIGLSIVSLVIVIFIVMFLIYRVVNRESIFNNDPMYNKISGNALEIYRYNQLEKYDYLTKTSFNEFLNEKYEGDNQNENFVKAQKSLTTEALNKFFTAEVKEGRTTSLSGNNSRIAVKLTMEYAEKFSNEDVTDFYNTYKKKGYYLMFFVPTYSRYKKGVAQDDGLLYAVKEFGTFRRLGIFMSKLFTFETINDVKDENLKERYIRWEWDKRSNMPALVGSGTTHKYLIYFDGRFPFVHQNILHIRLGESNVVKKGFEFSEIISQPTGEPTAFEQEIADGSKIETSMDYHTVTYSSTISSETEMYYGVGEHYINASNFSSGLSRIGNSFVMGIISTIIAYVVGLPLGVLMSRKKGKLVDKLGMALIIFITAVPTLAYIFMFAGIGVSVFKLPYNWALASIPILAFILPTFSLTMPQLTGQMKWTRRFMIDQQNSDYVKFAKSQGLSEREIFSKHIFRNALIYLVHGIPGAIIASFVGAIITERVYSVPGVGGLLTNAIGQYDNSLIVAVAVFYATLSIIALILGDLLLAKYDPRVSFTNSKG